MEKRLSLAPKVAVVAPDVRPSAINRQDDVGDIACLILQHKPPGLADATCLRLQKQICAPVACDRELPPGASQLFGREIEDLLISNGMLIFKNRETVHVFHSPELAVSRVRVSKWFSDR